MNMFFRVLLLLTFGFTSAFSQNHPRVRITESPSWFQKQYTGEHNEISNKEVNTGYCYQTLEYHINVPEETTTRYIRKRVISSDGLQACGNISIKFDPTYQKLNIHAVNVVRKGKTNSRLSSNSFNVIQQERSSESYIYDGELTAFCILDDIQVGDEIDFCYTIIGRNPLENGRFASLYYLSFSEPIGEITYRLTVSASDSINIKSPLYDKPADVTKNGSKRTYNWRLVNAAVTKYDDEAMHGYDPYPRIEVSSYNNWSQVAEWAIPHYDTSIPSGTSLAKWVEDQEAQDIGTTQKIRNAITMVQQEIRYLGLEAGISSYKPHPVQEVFANKYGDCKDKSLLLVSILNALNVTAYPALVNTRVRDSLTNRLPSPYAFDHCIVFARDNNHDVWIDPTMNTVHGPLNRITTPRYGKALLIKPDEADLVDVEIKAEDALETTEHFVSKAFDQPVSLKVKSIYTGYSASNMRNYYASSIHENISDSYLDYYASLYPEIELADQFSFEDDTLLNIITVHENYLINNFWGNLDSIEDKSVSCEFYPKTFSSYIFTPSDPIRTSRYKLKYPQLVRHVIIADLPEEWSISKETKNINPPGVKYSSSSEINGKQLKLTYNFRTTRAFVEPEEIPDYMEKMDEIWSDLGYSLWQNGTDVDSLNSISPWLILLALLSAVVAVIVLFKITALFDPPSKSKNLNPMPFGGWMILPMIGLTVSPLTMSWSLYNGGYFYDYVLGFLLEGPSGENFQLGLLVLAEIIWNMAFLAFTCFTIFQVYTKRTSAPIWMVAFYIANFSSLGLDVYLAYLVGVEVESNDIQSIFRAIVGAAIWIPYFLNSERVKQTFVNQLNPVIEPVVNLDELATDFSTDKKP